jgi:hypothetical protein
MRPSLSNIVLITMLVVGTGLGCAGVKRPWRDYSPIPFNSAAWLAGDKIERGRMLRSMFRNPEMDVSSREAAVKTLGEPDLKKTIENREVWFYRIDQGIVGAMDLIPISFDDKGRGSTGMVKGGTMSIAAKEDEL